MKAPLPQNEQSRFSGHLRHYHRSGSAPKRTWEEWVGDNPANSARSAKWLKIAAIVMALIALGGIITGLVIELQ